MAEMSYEEFLNKVILEELHDLIFKFKYHYLGFILISVAIEYLGAFMELNACPLEERGRSEERFNKGLKLFPRAYYAYAKEDNRYYMFTYLRCGLVHQLRPTGHLNLTHRE